jgi:nascent polypeptide-associated complex subunit alpha
MSVEEINEVPQEQIPAGANVTVASKIDKKAKKAFEKAGLKKVEGITRVTLRRGINHIFVIAEPEVYRNPATNSYIVFGEAKLEDLTAARAQQAAAAAARANEAEAAAAAPKDQASITADLEAAAAKVSLNDAASDLPEPTAEELKEAGLSEEDLALVKEQTTASNAQILDAFKKNGKDIINTIVALTA